MAKKRYRYTTMRRVGGDDGYCWSVFVNGLERVNGCTRSEASYYRDKFEREESEKRESHGPGQEIGPLRKGPYTGDM